MKAYVIMEKGFEYDDNIYNPTDGGNPKTIIFGRKDAEEKAHKLEIEVLKDINIQLYTYDIEDAISSDIDEVKSYLEDINTKYGKPEPKNRWDEFGEYQLNPKATDDEAEKYLSMLSIRFFEIVEVEVDVQSLRNHQIEEILS